MIKINTHGLVLMHSGKASGGGLHMDAVGAWQYWRLPLF
jgi:hypothetical protein